MKTDLYLFALLLALACSAHAESRWKLQFFHDKDKSSLEIRDLQCPSASNCLAAAILSEQGKAKPKGTLVITSDGGEHWSYTEVKDLPYSLFFLDGSTGWMTTDKGIYQTLDTGESWKKLNSLKGVERVWFLDGVHGFAVGEGKSIYETKDGGKDWAKREVADPRPMEAKDVVFDGITFIGPKRGMISGSWNPMQGVQQMEWLEMDASRRPKLPISAILVETVDGGQTWSAAEAKVQGRLTRLRFQNDTAVLALVEFVGASQVPSEIFSIGLKSRDTTPLLHQTGRVARDFVILSSGEVITAAVELLGKSNDVPIPGKLKMMASTSLTTWLDEKSDYRAVAMKPILAAADAKHVWVATDTGMILKRVDTSVK